MTISTTSTDDYSIGSVRFVTYLSVVSFVLFTLIKWLSGIREKIALIDSLPGPTSFSTLLGNIPFEIMRRVGSNFEDSKDFYYSEYSSKLLIIIILKSTCIFRSDAGCSWIHTCLSKRTDLSALDRMGTVGRPLEA